MLELGEYLVLPFGLRSGPRQYTKLTKPVMSLLRRMGIRSVIYLGDLILMNQSKTDLEKDRDTAVCLFQSLGLIINRKKFLLSPVT